MTAEEFRRLALAFPGAEEGFSQGSTAFKVNGKILARLLDEDRAMLAGLAFDERDLMLEAEPATYYITPHYKDYPGFIARLSQARHAAIAALLEQRFRQIARKSELKTWQARS